MPRSASRAGPACVFLAAWGMNEDMRSTVCLHATGARRNETRLKRPRKQRARNPPHPSSHEHRRDAMPCLRVHTHNSLVKHLGITAQRRPASSATTYSI